MPAAPARKNPIAGRCHVRYQLLGSGTADIRFVDDESPQSEDGAVAPWSYEFDNDLIAVVSLQATDAATFKTLTCKVFVKGHPVASDTRDSVWSASYVQVAACG